MASSTGLGFPASRVENVPSPEKLDSKEENPEAEPPTATDTLLLPEFEGEEMIGDGELPDLVRVVNGGATAGKDSTPDFEEEERKMLVEERKESKEEPSVPSAMSPVVTPVVTPKKSPKTALVKTATPRNSMADFSLLCATPGGPASEDDAIRQELLWQQQLLERDKEIHEEEKQLQRMQTEIAEAELKKAMDEESSRQMMLVVDEYEKTISEVLSERDREKLLHDIEVEKTIS